MKYFLLLIAALAIAIAIAPYLREQFLSWFDEFRMASAMQRYKWTLALGRYFLRLSKRLESREQNNHTKQVIQENGAQQQATSSQGQLTLGKLTPVRDADNIDLYERELIGKLDDPDVKNIAITGPYGSGKSSIIKTFFQKHLEFQPLYVSLAAFKDDRKVNGKKSLSAGIGQQAQTIESEESDITPEQQKVLDDRIEYSILQQLFYHVRGKDVPFSRLKRIRTVTKSRIASLALLVTGYALCLLFVYVPTWLPGYDVWKNQLPRNNWLKYLAITAIVAGAIYLVYLLFKFQQNASMIKLNLDRAELEIAPDKGSSVLNQHMDEIVYYFGATQHDLLVIEDLDRFKNPEIFVKLREINTLINNSLQINRKVTFIYALRDDVFIDESRTKFFDFILPVIPVTNAVNSASRLINMFENLQLPQPISRNFLSDLSLFITDRRLIQNIFNEFRVYYHQLNNPALRADMLLALIVYKNLHPTDFSDLQSNKGMVYEFLQRKGEIIAEMLADRENEIAQLEEQLRKVESERMHSLNELKILYLGAVYAKIYQNKGNIFTGRLYINNSDYNFSQILEESLFEILQQEHTIQYINSAYSASSAHFTFSDIENSLNTHQSYTERKDIIVAGYQIVLTKIKEDLNRLNDQMRLIKGKSIKELLIDRKLSTFNTPINHHQALAYLVGRGYISEDYWFYVSYFQPGQLTEKDFQYIMAVKNRSSLGWDHELVHLSQVISRLDESDCLLPEVLNYDLVNYLIKTSPLHVQKLDAIIGQIAALKKDHWLYLEGFRSKYDTASSSLVARLIKVAPHFWSFVKRNAHNDPLLMKEYLRMTIESGEIEAMGKFGDVNEFTSDIDESSYMMERSSEHLFERITPVLKRFDIKFKKPPEHEVDKQGKVFRYVWENNHYALNPRMVDFMLAQCYPVEDTVAFEKGQLTEILKGDIPYFSGYVQANLDEFVKNVFLSRKDHTGEFQGTLVKLLTPQVISPESRKRVIEQVSFQIDKLDEQSPDIYDQLVEFDRVTPTWYNLQVYRDHKEITGINDEMIRYLAKEQTYKALSQDRIDEYEEQEKVIFREMLIDLLQHTDVSISCKMRLLSSTAVPLSFTSFKTVGDTVIKELQQLNMIAPDEATLKALKEVNFPAFAEVLQSHWSETSKFLDRLQLSLNQYQLISSNPSMSAEQKTDLYGSMTPEILQQMLLGRYSIPTGVFKMDKFSMDATQLQTFAGKVTDPQTVIELIEANLKNLTETVVINLLEPLGGSFAKIATRQGKEVTKSDLIIRLLKVLEEANLLVDKFDEKHKVVQVNYLHDS